MKAKFWSNLTTRDFAALDAARTVAVLPVAATEQHGPHLPLSVDSDLLDGIIATAIGQMAHLPNDLPVLFLPTQAIGLSPEHARFAGTLTLSATTLLQVWKELGACVARSGVKKLLIFNSHGGQVSAMDIVARELRSEHNLLVYSSSWYQLPLGEQVMALFPPEEHRFGIHAGDIETSMMLALQPQWVKMNKAQNFASSSQTRAANYALLGDGKSAKLGWQMQDYHGAGAVGNAAAATPEKGALLIDAAAQKLIQLLTELVALPLSTLVDRPEDDSNPP